MITYVEKAIQSLLTMAELPKKEMTQRQYEDALVEIAVMLMITQMGASRISVRMNSHIAGLVSEETKRIIEHFKTHPLFESAVIEKAKK